MKIKIDLHPQIKYIIITSKRRNQTMSKRTLLTTLVIPALLISGLIVFLINNRQSSPAELVLTHRNRFTSGRSRNGKDL